MTIGVIDVNYPAQVADILPRYLERLSKEHIDPVFVWNASRTVDIPIRLAAADQPLSGEAIYVISPDTFYCDTLQDEIDEFSQSGEAARLVHVQFGVEHILARGSFLATCPDMPVRKMPQAMRFWARGRHDVSVKLIDRPGRMAYLKPDLPEGVELLRQVYENDLPRTSWNGVNHHLTVLGREKMRRYLLRLNVLFPLEDKSILEMGCSAHNPVVADLALNEFGAKDYVGVNVAPFHYSLDPARAQLIQQDIHQFVPRREKYDLVFSLAALEHIPQPVELIHKVPKWLRPRGAHYGIYFVWS